MNLIRGDIAVADGALCFSAPGLDQPLPPRLAAGAQRAQGRSAFLGIRPESIVVRGDGIDTAPRGAPWIAAPVYIQEPLGSDQFLTLDIGEARVKVRASPDLTVRAGDRVEVAFDPDKLHLFDGDTGTTLVSP
jgi:multiple sugar transport system ATP-binding protein